MHKVGLGSKQWVAPIWVKSALAITCLFCFIAWLLADAMAVPLVSPLPTVSGPLRLYGVGFGANGVYGTTTASQVPAGVTLYGSWIGSDANEGSVVTSWFAPLAHFSMMVAGYPTKSNLSLEVEVEYQNGERTRLALTDTNPRESWAQVDVALPRAGQIKRFRIRAADASRKTGGWLGFSAPYVIVQSTRDVIVGSLLHFIMYAGALLSMVVTVWSFPRGFVPRATRGTT
jgi:hypothetical protein